MSQEVIFHSSVLQYLLPAIVHINHQPYLERGDGPIVSYSVYFNKIVLLLSVIGKFCNRSK